MNLDFKDNMNYIEKNIREYLTSKLPNNKKTVDTRFIDPRLSPRATDFLDLAFKMNIPAKKLVEAIIEYVYEYSQDSMEKIVIGRRIKDTTNLLGLKHSAKTVDYLVGLQLYFVDEKVEDKKNIETDDSSKGRSFIFDKSCEKKLTILYSDTHKMVHKPIYNSDKYITFEFSNPMTLERLIETVSNCYDGIKKLKRKNSQDDEMLLFHV